MDSSVVEVALPNGVVALVRTAEGGDDGVAEKVGWSDRFDFDGVAGALEGIATAIRSGLERARPSKVTVELGLDVVVKAGKLTGLLVDGEGTGSLLVTLEWAGDAQPG
ncbi:MAG TPA: CU044_2847 family protein [Acidimicrobiales bacterium]|nr:CU044_2847 family protein [Acidimicrobiales bacterium]